MTDIIESREAFREFLALAERIDGEFLSEE